MLVRRLNSWQDERGYQYDEDFFTYSFVPNTATPGSGVSGTLAPGATATATVNIEQDSAFECTMFTAAASNNASDVAFGPSANINVQISDTAAGRLLFNEPMPMSLIAGDGQFGFILPTPRRFMPTGTIIMTFTNYDTAITYKNIQFNMVGRKLYQADNSPPLARFQSWQDPDSGRILSEDFFAYHFGFGSIAAGATPLVMQQLIESDSDFEMRLLSACNNAALNTGQNTAMQGQNQLLIKDGGSQRFLSQVPIIGPDYAGYKGVPMILPTPRIFLAHTTALVSLYNNSAATTIAQTDVAFIGKKIFEYGRE